MPIPYSLGDAIDWKQFGKEAEAYVSPVPYSLGDAIDWKLISRGFGIFAHEIPYSLGDAIDWKHLNAASMPCWVMCHICWRVQED